MQAGAPLSRSGNAGKDAPLADPVRVTFILWKGEVGGAETLAIAIAGMMRAQGHHACVLFICDAGLLAERLSDARVPYSSLGLRSTRAAFWSGKQIVRALQDQSARGVVLSTCDALARTIVKAGFSGRVVGVDHGALENTDALGPARRLWRRVSRSLGIRYLDVQVAVSEHVRGSAAHQRHARSLVRIYNGVDIDAFRPSRQDTGVRSGPLRVGMACRLIEGKGLPELIEVATLCQRRGLDAVFAVAGAGPLEAMLREAAERLDGRLKVHGLREDMADFWNAQDVALVIPAGLTESFGLVAVEAMACAVPVVASKEGGLVEVVDDGVNGMLVPAGDALAAYEALEAYAHDANLRADHGRAARDRAVRDFSLERTVDEYLAVLQVDLNV